MTLKLLIADDSATIQKVVRLAFEETDTLIESVTHGDEVGEVLNSFRPNVVLADISMPGMNGYQICALVKENPEFSDVPVVLLVGTFEKFDESEADRVHYDARLTKPFDPSELVNVVLHTLVGKNAENVDGASGAEASPNVDATLSGTRGQEVALKRMHISRRCFDSFVGGSAVLDLFTNESAKTGVRQPDRIRLSSALERVEKAASQITAEMMTEDALEAIVQRVVRKMSADVVSEIAWEIVPELSEVMIRRSLEEKSEE